MVFEKNRAHGQPEADGKSLRLKEGRWVSLADPMEIAHDIVAMAKSLKYGSQAEIGLKLSVDQSTVSRAIKAAEGLGLVEKGAITRMLREARDLAKELAEPAEPEPDYSTEEDIDL